MAKLVTLQDVNSNETIYPVTISSAVFNIEGESLDSIVSNLQQKSTIYILDTSFTSLEKDSTSEYIESILAKSGGFQAIVDAVNKGDKLFSYYANKEGWDGTYTESKQYPVWGIVDTQLDQDSTQLTLHWINGTDLRNLTIERTGSQYKVTTKSTYYLSAVDSSDYYLSLLGQKLDNIASGATKVSFTRNVTSGTKIGTITINDTATDIFAPTSGGTATDTNTTYTFTGGTNGSFTVKPSDGNAQTVSVVNLSGYATQSWVNSQNFATESYVNQAISDASISGGGGITSISQNTTGTGTGRIVTNVSGSTVYTRLLQTSDITNVLDGSDINSILSSSNTNISSSNLPIATKTSLGIVQIGNGLNITSAGVLSATWDSLYGKPSTFTPSSHTHTFNQITFNNTGTSSQYLAGDGNFRTISYSQISGTPNLSNYATKDQLDGLATESWVTDQINEISSSGGGGIQSISQNTSGSGTGRLVTSVSGSTVYVRSMTSSDVTSALGFTPTSLSSVQSWVNDQNFATESWVSSNYITDSELNGKGYLTSIPVASSSVLGGIKLGYSSTGKNYPVQIDSNNRAYVNVPWTDTTYTLSSLGGVGTINTSDSGYLTLSSSKSGTTVTITGSVSIPNASGSSSGLMTSTMYNKLNGIATGANNYVHPSFTSRSSGLYKITVNSEGHVSAATAVQKSDITALGIPAQDTTYSNATTSSSGLMSSTHVTSLMNSVNDIDTSYSNSNLYLNVSRTQGQNGFTVLLPLANSSNAGLMSPTQYGQLSNLDSTISTAVNNSLTSTTIINKLSRTDLVSKIGNASSTQDGLLSATDRNRFYGAINGVEYGTRAAAALNLVFSTVGSSNSVSGYNDISIAIPLATTQYAGLLTATEKGKLNRIATSGTFAYLDKQQTWTEYQDFTAGAGNSGSDMRFKKNISKVDNILDKALDIDIISYIWDKAGESTKDTFGVNATQLEELGGIFKKIVHERNDETKTKWVEYDRIGVLALKALQEYKVKMDKVIEDLQNQIEELKKK